MGKNQIRSEEKKTLDNKMMANKQEKQFLVVEKDMNLKKKKWRETKENYERKDRFNGSKWVWKLRKKEIINERKVKISRGHDGKR